MKHLRNLLIVISSSLLLINCSSTRKIEAVNIAKNSIKIDQNKIIASYNLPMLLGTNAGVFYHESYLMNPKLINNLLALKPGILRIPGGTWSNEIYWNGNGVHKQKESYIEKEVYDSIVKAGGNPMEIAFDMSKYDGKKWEIDYSGYSPGFRTHGNDQKLSDYHGFTDVLFLHKWIQSLGTETMVTVNMGTGQVQTAVEWLRWTKKRKDYALEPFDVKYWEMGNELDGHWEQGHILPDGSKMTGAEYARRYKIFATAMKKEDPTIKVGGSVASNMQLKYVEDIIKDTESPIDFISFHTYPTRPEDTSDDFVKMANHAAEINVAVAKIKGWLEKYRPTEKDRIEICLTEWNIKVPEDITTVDLTNALWSSVMLGEIAKSGIDVALQWDMFSTTETGGHGLFNPKDPNMTPRSQYWASYLWANYMGNTMIKTTLNTPDYVRAYTTIEDGIVSVMIINGSKEESATIGLIFSEISDKIDVKEISFSKEQYVLDPTTLIPSKSEKPSEKTLTISQKEGVTIAPFSIKIIQYSLN